MIKAKPIFPSILSNLLEKTTDAVIKAAKNGDMVLVSIQIDFPLFVLSISLQIFSIAERATFARIFATVDRSNGTNRTSSLKPQWS